MKHAPMTSLLPPLLAAGALLAASGVARSGLGSEGRWVAATPAFNLALCEHLDVAPLEFDGLSDSVFQEYDREGGRFMEYVSDHGHHRDVPYEAMIAAWKRHYPTIAATGRWPKPPRYS